METKESLNNSQGAENQVEDANLPIQSAALISYDSSNGLGGIVRSPYVLGAAALASFGGFSFGYDQGVISIILVMEQFHEYFPETAPGAPGFNVGFMTGMLELGAFIGCLFLPYLADRISRKWSLTVATFFFCVGAIIQTAANNYGTLVAGRTIGGVGVGTLAMGAPLYISEIAPPNLRGSLLVLEAISIVIGAIISYWITYGTREMAGEWAFRLPFLLQMAPALLVGIGIHFFPFSPRWLAMRGRDDDCLQSLCKLRRVPATDARVQAEWKGILSEVRFQEAIIKLEHPTDNAFKAEMLQWADLFRPKYLRRTAIALGIPFFQQFSGVNAFIIGVVVPEMMIKLGWGTYLFFGIFCVIAAIFSFFLVPETSKKALEQISELFGDNMIVEEEQIRRRIDREVWTDPRYQVTAGAVPAGGM
ncbi:hypothetical protein QQX98_002064 [Neonectria punicea]|uniref:Major facilitator superfamily (MFS) profile domain-containing protein n=1 Tax=Neonectria punicea TaxID=979145 RepID=A0ABR1HKS0_9HYPO